MGRETADAMFGPDAVRRALAEPAPDPLTSDLLDRIDHLKDPPGALRAWALMQPWPRFCVIVRVVSGAAAADLLEEADDE
jgi:hypothetical protein